MNLKEMQVGETGLVAGYAEAGASYRKKPTR